MRCPIREDRHQRRAATPGFAAAPGRRHEGQGECEQPPARGPKRCGGPPPSISITNVQASPTTLYAFGAPLCEVLPYVPLFAGHRIGIAVVSYAGGLAFGLCADRTNTTDLAVLADGIQDAFDELRRAARPPRPQGPPPPAVLADGSRTRRRARRAARPPRPKARRVAA